MKAQKPGRVAGTGLLDMGGRSVAQQVGDISDLIGLRLAFVEVEFAIVTAVRVVAREGAHDAEELVVAAPQRAEAGQVAEVPFADKRRPVAGATQLFGQGRIIGRHAHPVPRPLLRQKRLHQAKRKTVLVATGHDGNARIGAERRVGVGLREPNALRCQAIQRRSDVIGLTAA